jgi:hypothetical protein
MWVRYDDAFHAHPKVLEVKAQDPGAIALHLLCNTWSADSKMAGVVTLGAIVSQAGTKQRGVKWARILVAAGLWHAEGHDCDRCGQPPANGYVVHDFEVYNSQEKRRKNAEAGRRGAEARWHRSGEPADPHDEEMAYAIDRDGDPMAIAIDPSSDPMADGWHYAENANGDPMAIHGPVPVPVPQVPKNSSATPPPTPGEDDDPDWSAFWDVYPRKVDKPKARKAWRAAMKRRDDPKVIIEAARRFRADPKRQANDIAFTPHPATWLNGQRYNDLPDQAFQAVADGWWNN